MTTCPDCGGCRWELRRLESRVLHVDVDLSGDDVVVERTVVQTALTGLVDATCDACGHAADDALAGAVAAAAEAAGHTPVISPLADVS
jgi:hypothetical protein